MTKFTFQRKGEKIIAVTESGAHIAEFSREVIITPRGTNSYYDMHRAAKGDTMNYGESFLSTGLVDEVLAAAQNQLPKALQDAKWALRKVSADDNWAVFSFLNGLCGGCAWYGCTPKNVVAAVKRAQKNLSFEIA